MKGAVDAMTTPCMHPRRFCLPSAVLARPGPLSSGKNGFTLPEIALAIGIIALACVTLFGALASGQTAVRSALDDDNASRIFEALALRSQESAFAAVPAGNASPQLVSPAYYFDEAGAWIRTATGRFDALLPGEKRRAVYAAKLFAANGWSGNPGSTHCVTVLVLLCPVDSAAFTQLGALASQDAFRSTLASGRLDPAFRVHAMLVAKIGGTPVR